MLRSGGGIWTGFWVKRVAEEIRKTVATGVTNDPNTEILCLILKIIKMTSNEIYESLNAWDSEEVYFLIEFLKYVNPAEDKTQRAPWIQSRSYDPSPH